MGEYTQIHFASRLVNSIPKDVIDILLYMSGKTDDRPSVIPDHHLFDASDRWESILISDSYYFDYKSHCSFEFDKLAKAWFLSFTSNIKNYNDEIQLFLNWITPYVDKFHGEFLGYYRDAQDEFPTIIRVGCAFLNIEDALMDNEVV